ncbi:thymidine phosphorylase family protein [Solitalea lacus]|uniref:thymidine phosphorylase family protein n=1 Tax=Solitalea lacus TaxID=2911172 RepID=UPI001EDC102F|nr:thymidine phosphorylase family protein [Solitalea lacus]UKJ06700.1 thymidine phosphorylase family protein [Solitalea lacus]
MQSHHHPKSLLRFRSLGIDTKQELVVFMPKSCYVCQSEGFQALTRLNVGLNNCNIIATLNTTENGLLNDGEISLSISAIKKLGVKDGDFLWVDHLDPLESMTYVRSKLFGNALNQEALSAIISDVAEEKYSNIYLSSFVSACSGDNMNPEEICYLTKAMIETGNKLSWDERIIADKHCVGGIPGNRTSMIVVPIIASLGITIPKTSSRAITSPAGTADTMGVITNVNLSMQEMQKVVKKEKGCIVWGAAVKLSPADDIIIKIEKALDIDSEGQMVASILSKKVAAGSTHCVIDIPVGTTAKVRSTENALILAAQMEKVAKYIGLKINIIFTDGSQPVGFGIGPALEARDVLSVLRNEDKSSKELRSRALKISAAIIHLVKNESEESAYRIAEKQLSSEAAYQKLLAICEAQGGFNEPKTAKYIKIVEVQTDGIIKEIDNRKIARVAKLAGAPDVSVAGVDFFVQLNQKVEKGQPLFSIHANSPGELEYAYDYYKRGNHQIIHLNDE